MMDYVSVKAFEVPLFLREGEVFRKLKYTNEDLTVPRDCFKQNAEIKQVEDVRLLVSALAFWKVDVIPAALVQYCATHHADKDKVSAVFAEFESQLPYLDFLLELMNFLCFWPFESTTPDSIAAGIHNIAWSTSVESNVIMMCAMEFSNQKGVVWTTYTTCLAACHGKTKTLEFLHKLGCPWNAYVCSNAVKFNHLECLQYAHENGCPWTEETLLTALRAGPHTKCAKYCVENRCPGYATICKAVSDNLVHLQRAHAAGSPLSSACYEKAVADVACVRYLHEQSIPWHKDTCTWAAKAGNVEALQYVHKHGAVWTLATADTAAKYGRVLCLNYAFKHGCPSQGGAFEFGATVLCDTAAAAGHLDCLVSAHENGCPWSVMTSRAAAAGGHLLCLTYLHENGCPWDATVCSTAAWYGHLNVLIYLHENNCPWDEDTCGNAAQQGGLPCLRYAHEHGCPWDGQSVRRLYNECATYAREHNCPTRVRWEDKVTFGMFALMALFSAILFWNIANGKYKQM